MGINKEFFFFSIRKYNFELDEEFGNWFIYQLNFRKKIKR